jgi:hypothetical protein
MPVIAVLETIQKFIITLKPVSKNCCPDLHQAAEKWEKYILKSKYNQGNLYTGGKGMPRWCRMCSCQPNVD